MPRNRSGYKIKGIKTRQQRLDMQHKILEKQGGISKCLQQDDQLLSQITTKSALEIRTMLFNSINKLSQQQIKLLKDLVKIMIEKKPFTLNEVIGKYYASIGSGYRAIQTPEFKKAFTLSMFSSQVEQDEFFINLRLNTMKAAELQQMGPAMKGVQMMGEASGALNDKKPPINVFPIINMGDSAKKAIYDSARVKDDAPELVEIITEEDRKNNKMLTDSMRDGKLDAAEEDED